MKTLTLSKFAWLAGVLAAVSACGGVSQDGAPVADAGPSLAALSGAVDAPEHDDMLGMLGMDQEHGLPAVPPSATCVAIELRLKVHRAALKLTPEWDALTKTEVWGRIQSGFDAWKQADCKCHDTTPSDACKKLREQMHDNFAALKETPEYAAAEKTEAWQTLAQDYADAKAENCFKHKK